MSAREFPIGHVLTLMTGRMLCDVGGIYEIANHMTGESLMTHQLPRASRESEASLREQFPDLAAIDIPSFDVAPEHRETVYRAWLAGIEMEHGATRIVEPLTGGDHTRIDPIDEIRMMRPDLPILGVVVDGGAS